MTTRTTTATAGVLVLLVGSAVAGTRFGGDDTGFIPPSKDVAKCESSVVKAHAKAIACVLGCHKKRATGADETAEDACEKTGPARSSCKGKYNVATGNTSKIDSLCPPCLDAPTRSNFFGAIEGVLDALNSSVYCAGTTAWGGEDTGFLPPDKTTARCENTVGKAAARAALCLTACHVKRASGKLADATAEEECENGASKSSCKSKYTGATGTKLDATCPSCLGPSARAGLFGTLEFLLDADNHVEYCASPSGAFLDLDPAR